MSHEYRERERQSLDFTEYQDTALSGDVLRTRLLDLAVFLGATPDDLVLTTGTLEGLNLVAHGLDLQPGDEVLTTSHDHPAAVYPWLLEARRRGIKVVQLPQPGVPASPEAIVSRFAADVDHRTRFARRQRVLLQQRVFLQRPERHFIAGKFGGGVSRECGRVRE